MTTVTSPPAWYDDPTARHRLRYWDGEQWTAEVSDAGQVSTDELQVRPPPRTPGRAPAPWYTRWWVFVLAFVVLAVGITIPIRMNTTKSTTTPAPSYPGRLLIAHGTNPVTVQALTSASTDPSRVGTAPLEEDAQWASIDGTHLVANDGTIAAVGAQSRDYLPELDNRYFAIAGADFSRDGTKLAYAAAEGGMVVVYDVAAKSGHVVLQTPCESYGVVYTKVCGQASGVVWIDDTTVFVGHFAGELPQQVTCSGPSSGFATSCEEPPANTYSMVTTDGTIIVSLPGSVAPLTARGATVVLADGTWLDVNEIRAGTATPKALPAGALRYSLSSDGTHVVVAGDSWQLIDIRTGAVQQLGARGAVEDVKAPCAWSPDGAFAAVQVGDEVRVVPMSTAAGGSAGSIDGRLIGWTT